MKEEESASSAAEATREERDGLSLTEKEKRQQWLQKLSALVLPEEDGLLPEEEKQRRVYLWCSKAVGFEKRALYWNTVSTEVNALHRLVVGRNSSDGAISQLHRIETQLMTEGKGVPDWNSLLNQMMSEVVRIDMLE